MQNSTTTHTPPTELPHRTDSSEDALSAAELARLLPRGGERRWSERVPALYPLAVRYHRVRRRIEWMRAGTAYARTRQSENLPNRVKRHKSLLLRQLGESEMWMQHNKVTNLKLACAQVDGVLIRPGETDNGRVLPWGVGCSIVYNYVDLQFRNDTDQTFQLRVGVGERYLEGEILAERQTSTSYRVFARGERFLRAGPEHYRRNEIWRTTIDRRTGSPVGDELIRENVALVKYIPTDVHIIDLDLSQHPPTTDPVVDLPPAPTVTARA